MTCWAQAIHSLTHTLRQRDDDGTWRISHKDYIIYIHKIQPLPLEKDRQTHQPMSDKEHTMLRQLLGSLQWPAVQSSPRIQASTSLLSGEMSGGLSSPLLEANKLLRFAKSNADLHLKFPPIGALEDLRITCMFDAALGVRHDQSSQGGYLILLTNKKAFKGVESPYHILDWRSFRLPRVARSSLAAEVQAAAQAVDSTEFVVRFWHMLLNPTTSLKDTLQISNPSLAPTPITDAKALYDSFHRDAINHGATDKRTNLELRVIREQVEGIGGVLRWISSERQFGDGFTKMAARQLLADRIRHGAIKFTFDPGYTASKKKTAAQRAKSRNEFTTTVTTTNHNQLSHNHNAADDDVPVNNMSPVSNDVDENDLAPENNTVPENAIVSENVEISEYAMMAEYAAVSEETFARPSHGARPIFQFLLAAVLPMISGGTDLVPFAPFGSGMESRQCDAAEEFAYHRADKSWWPLLVSFAVFWHCFLESFL